jgi:hypothetical protein
MRTANCNTTFVAAGCADLPASVGDGFISTYWKPSQEDLVLLAAGFPVKLSILGGGLPPLAMEVESL